MKHTASGCVFLYVYAPVEGKEISLSLSSLYIQTMMQVWKLTTMQVHNVKQITSNLGLHVFCRFPCSDSDECFQATNWTADRAC